VTKDRAKRKLTAILSADVKGYSRLMGDDEVATIETLKHYRELIGKLVMDYRGRVVDSPGDNILSEFSSVVDAVECAVKIQEELKEKNTNLPENRRMEFRIGVNLGDVIEDESRIYGDGINVAARLEALADPGGICISRTAYDQIEDKLPLAYEYLGEKTVKNIPKPIRAYRVLIKPEGFAKKWRRKWTAEHRRKAVDRDEKIESRNEKTRTKSGDEDKSLEATLRFRDRNRFRKHLHIYAGVIVFFAIINIFTWHGIVWFHWPALIWGLMQWIVWIKGSIGASRKKP